MDDLSPAECKRFLQRHRVGVMALAKEGASYALPLFFAYDGKRLYFQSHPGEKDKFLVATNTGSFMVVQVEGEEDWASVQANGPVEKITLSDDAMRALNAMAENPFPPEFGIDVKGNPKRSSDKMYLWMMTPNKITGRRSPAPVKTLPQ